MLHDGGDGRIIGGWRDAFQHERAEGDQDDEAEVEERKAERERKAGENAATGRAVRFCDGIGWGHAEVGLWEVSDGVHASKLERRART
jgi:hypothetical protein